MADVPFSRQLSIHPALREFIHSLKLEQIPSERVVLLEKIAARLREDKPEPIGRLNFICTHNSRRSQLAQVWAELAVRYYGLSFECTSGGTEVTAFYPSAVKALQHAGFRVEKKEGKQNPHYFLHYAEAEEPVEAFSKRYDAVAGTTAMLAIMTCSQADQNCPFIPMARARYALTYEDPKAFDGTPGEVEAYQAKSRQIATEIFFLFKTVIQA